MMRKLSTFIACLLSASCFVSATAYALPQCGVAPATTSPAFCAKFKEIAMCNCVLLKPADVPGYVCSNMTLLYGLMLARSGGSLEGACASQSDVPAATCVAQWNYYRSYCP